MVGWSTLVWMAVACVAFVFMEYWARWVHGKVWHGVLYPMHHSHHSPRTWWEWNDILSASHAPISVALILYGCWAEQGLLSACSFGFGVGMACFGVAYIVVHDGVVHGRLPVQFLLKIPAMAAIRRAHRIHHATGSVPYGLFLGPNELEQQSPRRPVPRGRSVQTGH